MRHRIHRKIPTRVIVIELPTFDDLSQHFHIEEPNDKAALCEILKALRSYYRSVESEFREPDSIERAMTEVENNGLRDEVLGMIEAYPKWHSVHKAALEYMGIQLMIWEEILRQHRRRTHGKAQE